MTLRDGLDLFLHKKAVAGLESGSIRNYRVTLSLFLDAIGPDLPVGDLTLEGIEYYILKLYPTVSKGTASSYVRNIRIFCRWLSRHDTLSFDPADIAVPRPPKKQIHLYTDDELRLIFDMVVTSVPWITARNRAVIALMLDSGLRQIEVCRLLLSGIDRDRQVLKVTGKGSKDRTVSLGLVSLVLIDDYIRLCPYDLKDYVFLDRHGQPLSGNAVRLFVYRLQSQLPFPLSSHKLRHNYATNYCVDHIRETGKSDVYDLSILMGHESIETTKKYEHFAHELIAAENHISHLDGVYKISETAGKG